MYSEYPISIPWFFNLSITQTKSGFLSLSRTLYFFNLNFSRYPIDFFEPTFVFLGGRYMCAAGVMCIKLNIQSLYYE